MKLYKKIISQINYNLIFNKKIKKYSVYFIFFVLILLISWLMGYKYRDNVLRSHKTKIYNLVQDTSELKQNISDYELDLMAYNKIIEDNDYLRYIAFKHSDIIIPKSFNPEDLKLVYRLSIRFNIPQEYIYRLIYKESRFKPNLTSSAGAKGYMQVMPGTYKSIKRRYENKFGSIDRFNNNQKNIIIGTYYLHILWKKYKSWKLVFAAYNAGSGRVEQAGNRVPNIIETRNYVNFITKKD